MMFAKLLAHPEVQEVVELRNKFGFMAYHGGGLEQARSKHLSTMSMS